MRSLLPGVRAAAVALVAGLTVLTTAPAALAESDAAPRPSVDPAAPTPTAPMDGGPPQGTAPDGSTVGGAGLDTRGLVTVDGAPALPEGIDARGWLVADMDTGEVLGAQDPHGRYYPASTLKTLTLLTLVGQLDPTLVVEGTREDESVEGSRVGLVAGGQYPVSLLFDGLVMQSGNDAANALARAAGGVPATLEAMNATAERIGALDTVAGTPSGLDVAGQSSSPYDLALIMRQLIADPTAAAILQTQTAQMPAVAGLTEGYQIQSQNTLLTEYPGTLGGKTGFTDAARHTFVAAAERDGRRLVVSLMQTERYPVSTTEQAERLLDWGFAAPTGSGVGTLVDPGDTEPVALPSAVAPDDGSLSPEDAVAAAQAEPAAAAASSGGESSVLVPLALGVGAVGIVGATLVGRRRAMTAGAPAGRVSRSAPGPWSGRGSDAPTVAPSGRRPPPPPLPPRADPPPARGEQDGDRVRRPAPRRAAGSAPRGPAAPGRPRARPPGGSRSTRP
ncbi:D-alanyl-D-alanine carboxypeptidase family protein [Geodermatophilus sp. Leaf369]|uniref:D-alanyl-D-alanine carboxypeptidase family protein n=1 Tax=Geodermatophilus sp. Leaf369 TaxID=1736354 RepID=UPI0009E8AF42|nr:serine hydrolase [Geodermatophilus sp. Leaf369]